MATRKTKRRKKKTARKTATRDRSIYFLTSSGEEIGVSDRIEDHLRGICKHGIDKCGTCSDRQDTGTVLAAIAAGGVGLLLGAVLIAASEPGYYEPSRRTILVLPGFDGV